MEVLKSKRLVCGSSSIGVFGTTGQGVKFSQLSNCFDWHFLRSWWWVALKGTLSEAWFSWIMELTVYTSGYVSCFWSIGLPLILPALFASQFFVFGPVFLLHVCIHSFGISAGIIFFFDGYVTCYIVTCSYFFCGESVLLLFLLLLLLLVAFAPEITDTPSCGRCRKLAYIEMIRFLEMSVPSMIVCLKTTI